MKTNHAIQPSASLRASLATALLTLVTFTGTVQLLSGATLILTGIVLLLYGNASWPALRSAHHLLTYLLLVSVALHFLSPKQRG